MGEIFLSIIIPTYKRSDNLERAIKSVLSQEGNYELIIVDDNDEDSEYRKKNEQLMKKYIKHKKLTYIKHKKNKNGAAARNTGIKAAKGEYVTFLDDDDEFTNTRIKEIQYNLKDKKTDFAYTGFITKKNNLIQKKVIPNTNKNIKNLQYQLLCQNSFFGTGSNIICKRSLVNEIKGFDETFIRHQDLEFVIRLLEKTNVINVIPTCTVIKHTDDIGNIPTFEKMLITKQKYLNKFENLINSYTTDKQNKIKVLNYYELLTNAYIRNNKKEKQLVRQCLKATGIYSIKKELKIYLKEKIKKFYIVKKIRSIIKK